MASRKPRGTIASAIIANLLFLIISEAPRPQAGASRKRITVLIMPLDPAYKAGLAGHLPVSLKKAFWNINKPFHNPS